MKVKVKKGKRLTVVRFASESEKDSQWLDLQVPTLPKVGTLLYGEPPPAWNKVMIIQRMLMIIQIQSKIVT